MLATELAEETASSTLLRQLALASEVNPSADKTTPLGLSDADPDSAAFEPARMMDTFNSVELTKHLLIDCEQFSRDIQSLSRGVQQPRNLVSTDDTQWVPLHGPYLAQDGRALTRAIVGKSAFQRTEDE